jgi:hypothetical protein
MGLKVSGVVLGTAHNLEVTSSPAAAIPNHRRDPAGDNKIVERENLVPATEHPLVPQVQYSEIP